MSRRFCESPLSQGGGCQEDTITLWPSYMHAHSHTQAEKPELSMVMLRRPSEALYLAFPGHSVLNAVAALPSLSPVSVDWGM